MNKEIKFKFDWLLWFLILLPTFYVVGKDLRHVQMNFFQISIILMLAVLHINRWFGLFLVWAAFQMVFFSDAPNKSIVLQNIFFAGVLYHFVVKYVVSMKRYFWVFFGILVLNVAWAGLQHLQFDPIFNVTNPQYQARFTDLPGFFALPAFLGNYAAIVAPLCTVLNPFLGIAVVPALILSKSSFSILAAGAGVLFFLWFRKRIVFWVALILIVASGSFYVLKYDAPSGQFERRLILWKVVVKECFKTQFFGHGMGAYGHSYGFIETMPNQKTEMFKSDKDAHLLILNAAIEMKKQPVIDYMVGKSTNEIDQLQLRAVCQKNNMDFDIWNNPHNEFLQVFFDMGLIGLLILFGYVFNLFQRFFRAKKDPETIALAAAFLAIVIVSFAHFPFYVARLGGPCLVIMALFETKLLRSENAD